MLMKAKIKFAVGIWVLMWLTACGINSHVPVEDLAQPVQRATLVEGIYSTNNTTNTLNNTVPWNQPDPDVYKVRQGDTLYAIAFRYGWDYKKLAQLNNITDPYMIYVGQRIFFKASLVPSNKAHSGTSTSIGQVATTLNSTPTAKKNKPQQVAQEQTKVVSKPVKAYAGISNLSWQWPLSGKLVQAFNSESETSKGIDIAAAPGSKIKSAATGQVVYAGDGIQGYGNLLIVKHNNTYLSAYAYNSRLLVAEGDVVKVGQVVAHSGKGPKLDGRLHFEIRKDGKPVNPQAYLPK